MKRSILFLAAAGLMAVNAALLTQPSEVEAYFDDKETCANSGGHYFCENYIVQDCRGNPACGD